MKNKLLSLQPSTWYSLEGRPDRNEIIATIKQLQSEKHDFQFTEDGDKFMLVSVYEPEVECNCFFDYIGKPGYEVKKEPLGHGRFFETIHYNGLLVATR